MTITTHQDLVDLAMRLIEAPSVSPDDCGCQALLAARLAGAAFAVEHMPFEDVANLWAVHGTGSPVLAFAGHTDVVPPGPDAAWHTNPFEPVIRDGMLYGRGAADMKGSLAAMTVAAERFVRQHPDHRGSLAFLITSDEEAAAINGTRKVMATLEARHTVIDWCVVGEPSSDQRPGDVVRIGRRGSLNATLTVKGIQGHVAYPADARNPIHEAMPALSELTAMTWDQGNSHFPPTSMQISNINSGTGATNVIPGELTLLFNFRFSTESTATELMARTTTILDRHGLDYDINWSLSGEPFLTTGTRLIQSVQQALASVAGCSPVLSTSGGTSDGRFIAPTGTEVVELGPCNATIHKVNESVAVADLLVLSDVYLAIMTDLLAHDR